MIFVHAFQAILLLIYVVYIVVSIRRDRADHAARLAKLDLRQAYPPRRDRFHRDLERMNRLRDCPRSTSRGAERGDYVESSLLQRESGR